MRHPTTTWMALAAALALCACGDGESATAETGTDAAGSDTSTCTPGMLSCSADGKTVERCGVDGRATTTHLTCKSDEVCRAGACVDAASATKEPECTPGERRCDADGLRVQTCGASEKWELAGTCDSGRICLKGECTVPPCAEGKTRCSTDGRAAETCDASGKFVATACELGKECIAGKCSDPPECAAGVTRCTLEGTGTETCASDGMGWDAEVLCKEGEICTEGKCGAEIVVEEKEAKDAAGENDTFDRAELVDLDRTVLVHSGENGDKDHFAITASEPGIVTVIVDASEVIEGGEIRDIWGAVYAEPWIPSLVAVAGTDYEALGCTDRGTTKYCEKGFTMSFDVHPNVNRYVIRVHATGISAYGMSGADPDTPYRVRVQFRPGRYLESDQPKIKGHPEGYDDVWHLGPRLELDGVTHMSTEVKSYAWHHNDQDWLTFLPKVNGTLHLTSDVTASEDGLFGVFSIHTQTGVYLKTGDEVERIGNVSVGDSPNCSLRHAVLEDIRANKTYLLRVNAFTPSNEHPYVLRLEYGPGSPEEEQPGDVGPADGPTTAHDLGVLAAQGELSAESYFWVPNDRDWYRFRTPPEGDSRNATLTLDFTAIHEAHGFGTSWNCPENPHGVSAWLYLFSQEWYQGGEREFSDHLTRATEDDAPSQSITWSLEPNREYHVLVFSRRNRDRERTYELRVSYD